MVKNERGQATVELAFALVIFMLLLFAIVDFGRIFHAYLTIEHAGKEGARVASLGAPDSEVFERIKTSAATLEEDDIKYSITPNYKDRKSGSYVTIQVTYPVAFSFPVLQNMNISPLTMKSKTVMRVE